MVNRSVTWADWDEDLLALELDDLRTTDFDLSLTGFDVPEIDTLLAIASRGHQFLESDALRAFHQVQDRGGLAASTGTVRFGWRFLARFGFCGRRRGRFSRHVGIGSVDRFRGGGLRGLRRVSLRSAGSLVQPPAW